MIEHRKFKLKLSEKQDFFDQSEVLTSQIQKNARDHAIQLVKTWAGGKYRTNLKQVFKDLKDVGELSPELHHQLCAVGKYLYSKPTKLVTQDSIDQYWEFLLDEDFSGKVLEVRDNIPMRLSENTCRLENPDEAFHAAFWLSISTLKSRKVVWIPLSQNPYVKSVDDVTKGFHVRKDKRGKWRLEAVERKDWAEPPEPEEDDIVDDPLLVGIDVGLNVIAATSDGQLYGEDFKPKFYKLYHLVQKIRKNRQRQGLKENSIRLDRLETYPHDGHICDV